MSTECLLSITVLREYSSLNRLSKIHADACQIGLPSLSVTFEMRCNNTLLYVSRAQSTFCWSLHPLHFQHRSSRSAVSSCSHRRHLRKVTGWIPFWSEAYSTVAPPLRADTMASSTEEQRLFGTGLRLGIVIETLKHAVDIVRKSVYGVVLSMLELFLLIVVFPERENVAFQKYFARRDLLAAQLPGLDKVIDILPRNTKTSCYIPHAHQFWKIFHALRSASCNAIPKGTCVLLL